MTRKNWLRMYRHVSPGCSGTADERCSRCLHMHSPTADRMHHPTDRSNRRIDCVMAGIRLTIEMTSVRKMAQNDHHKIDCRKIDCRKTGSRMFEHGARECYVTLRKTLGACLDFHRRSYQMTRFATDSDSGAGSDFGHADSPCREQCPDDLRPACALLDGHASSHDPRFPCSESHRPCCFLLGLVPL